MSAPWRSAGSLIEEQPISSSQRLQAYTSSPELRKVVTTHIICKDYDPVNGKKLINQYMVMQEIGRGVHGKVKLAEDTDTGELVAIKIVDKRTRDRQLSYTLLRGTPQHQSPLSKKKPEIPIGEQKVRQEIAILKKCAHPNVVKLREVVDDPASNKIYMVLEYMEGGEVRWQGDDGPLLALEHTRSIFRGVVSGLDYLHYQGIIHRDIKPANLLYSGDGIVKISDFGVSYYHELLAGDYTDLTADEHSLPEQYQEIERELATTAGSPAFFAPELCYAGVDEGEADLGPMRVTRAIDVWALGVTLYCFIFGCCPFIAETELELFSIIATAEPELPDTADPLVKDLLLKLLIKSPEKRMTLEQVKIHPWVIADLSNPSSWLQEADPKRYRAVEVTDDEVTHAVTVMERLRRSIHKLSHSLAHLAYPFTHRRSKSASPRTQPRRPSQPYNHSDVPTPSMPFSTLSSRGQSLYDAVQSSTLSQGLDVSQSEQFENIRDNSRPDFGRKASTASSMSSGLFVSFTKHS